MQIASNKIKDVARYFRDELKSSYGQDELEILLAYCFESFLNIKRIEINLRENDTMSESELLKFNFAVKDLKKQKPIQYILGEADFYRLKFKVNEHVLIPRPETEELVDLIIKEYEVSGIRIQNGELSNFPTFNIGLNILDIGTGSGCIPIALKKNIPIAIVSAIDISGRALEVARQNAELNEVEVNFILHDILSDDPIGDIESKYDIIVSNPPYVCISEKENMEKNVLDYEPHLALFVDDNDPLLFYKKITDFALSNLKENGKIYFEINQVLAFESKDMLENKGFKNVKLVKDLNDNYRILQGNI
jgi:release factor glutamine methyltransferase